MSKQRGMFEEQRRQDLINAKSRLAQAAYPPSDGRAETFNLRSGQIFIEQTVSIRPRNLIRHSSAVERKIHLTQRGPATLQDIARREFIRYLESLPANASEELIEVLQSVPWQVAQQIWADAEEMDLAQPLMVWCAFTHVYKHTKKITYHKTAINRPEPDDLPLYISRMSSNSMSWLVCLTVTAPFTHTDIINLSNLRNLVVLDIGASRSTPLTGTLNLVTDSVVRAWGRAVKETDAFPKLQALLIRNQPEITHLSLTYLNMFPSLVLYGVQSCFRPCRTTRAMAESLGWTTTDDHGVLRCIEKDIEMGYSWDCAMTSCYKHTTVLLPNLCSNTAEKYGCMERDRELPILSFRLGMTPRDILSPNALDKMTFFRARHAMFDQKAPSAAATSTHLTTTPLTTTTTKTAPNTPTPATTHPILLSRSTTKRLKRKKQFDVADILGDEYGGSGSSNAVTEPGSPLPTPTSMSVSLSTPMTLGGDAPYVPSSGSSSVAALGQMRRSMPPSSPAAGATLVPMPSQPVRSTSNFDLAEMANLSNTTSVSPVTTTAANATVPAAAAAIHGRPFIEIEAAAGSTVNNAASGSLVETSANRTKETDGDMRKAKSH